MAERHDCRPEERDPILRLRGRPGTMGTTATIEGNASSHPGLYPGNPPRRRFDAARFEDEVLGRRRGLHYQPLVIVLAAVVSGILFDRTVALPVPHYLIVAVGMVALVGNRVFSLARGSAQPWGATSWGLVVGLAAVGAAWHHLHWDRYPATEIGLRANDLPQPVRLRGRLESEPRPRASEAAEPLDPLPAQPRTQFRFRLMEIRNGQRWEAASGRATLVLNGPVADWQAGDGVELVGKLMRYRAPTNPGQFDFADWSRRRRELVAIHVYHSAAIEPWPPGSRVGGRLVSRLRHRFRERLETFVGGDQGVLASAILLGNREQLAADRRESFAVTGTIHLLAISGLHVGILGATLFGLFRLGWLGRRTFLWGTILFVAGYSWLVEFRPPVTRAAILLILLCLGRLYGRRAFSFHWLALAGLIVLAINPSDLFALGPQLSFLAMATIVFGHDWIFWRPSRAPLDRLIRNTRPFPVRAGRVLGRRLREAFLLSASIWLVAMPWVAYHFHVVTPIGLLLNPILVIPVALALYSGLGVMLVGGWCPPLASWLGGVCNCNLRWAESGIDWASGIPGGHWWTAGPTMVALVLFYGVLFWIAVWPPTRRPLGWTLGMTAAWGGLVWWGADWQSDLVERRAPPQIEATLVDVGHGNCLILRCGSRTLLYDAGAMGEPEFVARKIAGVLWSQRVHRIDVLVLSHADVDHFNAVPELLKRFSIGAAYVAPPMRSRQADSLDVLWDSLADRKVPVFELRQGDRGHWGPVRFHVLGPPDEGFGGSDNADSLVVRWELAGRSLLLTGDVEGAGMASLLRQPAAHSDVALAPHHGSPRSQPEAFADWATPDWMVISGSGTRVDESVADQWERKGIAVARTDQWGAVQIQMGPAGVRVQAAVSR